MSQVMDCITLQSLPAGQQRTVVFAASGIHVDVLGQQKLEGMDACGHFAKSAGQVDCRMKRDEAEVVVLRKRAARRECEVKRSRPIVLLVVRHPFVCWNCASRTASLVEA